MPDRVTLMPPDTLMIRTIEPDMELLRAGSLALILVATADDAPQPYTVFKAGTTINFDQAGNISTIGLNGEIIPTPNLYGFNRFPKDSVVSPRVKVGGDFRIWGWVESNGHTPTPQDP